MKTLRLALIAALVSATLVSMANTDGWKIQPKAMKVIYCTFEKAAATPGLVTAMYQQLNPGFLADEKPVYVVRVTFNGNVYAIRGTFEQWTLFFKHAVKSSVHAKNKPINDR